MRKVWGWGGGGGGGDPHPTRYPEGFKGHSLPFQKEPGRGVCVPQIAGSDAAQDECPGPVGLQAPLGEKD